jgi:hypothetical protein
MAKGFGGTINVDVRDSQPDWGPFEPAKAPDGAPNVLYVVLDDVGYSAMSCYGGPIETPNIDRIVAAGVRYSQFHTTALCSPTRSCLLTGRNHTRNSMACITEAAIGFPNASGTCRSTFRPRAQFGSTLDCSFGLFCQPASGFWRFVAAASPTVESAESPANKPNSCTQRDAGGGTRTPDTRIMIPRVGTGYLP